MILRRIKSVHYLLFILLIPLAIILPLIVIYLSYKYNNLSKFYTNIDILFSGRLNMQHTVLETYPVHWFQLPKYIPHLTGITNLTGLSITLDNSFITILEDSGIVGLLITEFFLIDISYRAIKIKDYVYCILIILIVISSLTESTLFSIYLDAPIICIYSIEKKMRIQN